MREVSKGKRKGLRDFALSPVPMVCRRGCPDRTWDCHGRCEQYKAYREACDMALHEKELQRDVVGTVCDRMANREKQNRR